MLIAIVTFSMKRIKRVVFPISHPLFASNLRCQVNISQSQWVELPGHLAKRNHFYRLVVLSRQMWSTCVIQCDNESLRNQMTLQRRQLCLWTLRLIDLASGTNGVLWYFANRMESFLLYFCSFSFFFLF